ncbi:TAF1 transcription initiation factor TFIID subunit TAF1 [Mycena floridula]|nr:TAF1 transcription initiation factor TFIID subunit TAF1 [Mycena floridula]
MAFEHGSTAISAFAGISSNISLEDVSLPGPSNFYKRGGTSGNSSLTSRQFNQDQCKDVGRGLGQDWEDRIDQEIVPETDVFRDEREEDENHVPGRHRRKPKRIRVVKRLVERPKTVDERFLPSEQDDLPGFSELPKGHTDQKSSLLGKRPFEVEPDQTRKPDVPRPRDFSDSPETRQVEPRETDASIEVDLVEPIVKCETTAVPIPQFTRLDDRSLDLSHLSNREGQTIYDSSKVFPVKRETSEDQENIAGPVNKALYNGSWTQSIVWGAREPFRDFTQVGYSLPEATRPHKRLRTEAEDKFNLSNDQFHDVAKDKQCVRKPLAELPVEHAYSAQKLQLPFYKTQLSKEEARSFHRPALQFHANVEIQFSKSRTAKSKKDQTGKTVAEGGNVQEALKRTSDLSLSDTSDFVLWEYSEEHPPIIPNFGMGSSLVNYYRKKHDKDDHVPKAVLGLPFVLEPSHESPFKTFGDVHPGQTIPTLYNSLVRAPLFPHSPNSTDFLVVKSTAAASDDAASGKPDVTRYYLREIKDIFVIGQTFPVTEVPGPHSRKLMYMMKHRLRNIAYKLLKQNPEQRLKVSKLLQYFPGQNELQMRQRLKEFMEYHRQGHHQGFWRLKENFPIPSDSDMLKLVTPEQVVLAESMQVGQRHLEDSGYNADDPSDAANSSHLSVEQQLAPWITTRNFLFANEGKAMLKLHGEGDPTGRGEAFNYIRISMKDIFVKAGENYEAKVQEANARPKSQHRYNVAAQKLMYESEIQRIWKAQFHSLSRTDPLQLTDEKGKDSEGQVVPPPIPVLTVTPILPGTSPQVVSFLHRTGYPQVNFNSTTTSLLPRYLQAMMALTSLPLSSPPNPDMRISTSAPATITKVRTPNPVSEDKATPSTSEDKEARAGSVGSDNSNKILRIQRKVDGKWRTELIRHPGVVKAYVRARQVLEDDSAVADSLVPTGDAEKDARYLKRLQEDLAKMKRNQERRLHRKNAKLVKEGDAPLSIERALKPETTRRCGRCGQVGHMKTNTKCPKWAEEVNSGTSATLTATPLASVLAVKDPPKIKLSLKRS